METFKTLKPSDHAEVSIIHAILDGELKPGSSLPPERILAVELGVTRPTLREALTRLDRDGWITIQHGKSTQVNDVLTEGGLNVLGSMVSSGRATPHFIVAGLLDVRCVLAPAYFGEAVRRNGEKVIALLKQAPTMDQAPDEFCRFDWNLHHQMCVLSENPVYTMILNGFRSLYQALGQEYFTIQTNREASSYFYRQLEEGASDETGAKVTAIVSAAMRQSLELWHGLGRI